MTKKEAIEELKEEWDRFGKAIPCDTCYGMIVNEAYKIAIAAMEKQIPKKPICSVVYTCGARLPGCPNCEHRIGTGVLYCPDCGQAIDWN